MDTPPNTFWSLFSGYTVLWLIVASYLVRLLREQRALRARVEQLEGKR